MDIKKALADMQEEKIKNFNSKLIPTVPLEKFIGIRTPILRKFAKEIYKNHNKQSMEFLEELPHSFFEENQLHCFLIEQIKDYTNCIMQIERFLPHIDNWATCDSLSPKVLKKYPNELRIKINEWVQSQHTYTVRYGVGCLLSNYLDEHFDENDLILVSGIKSDEYYINMMIAWYFSFALIKQYNSTIPYLENKKLGDFIHRKTIQKAIESTRISKETKKYLKTLRI